VTKQLLIAAALAIGALLPYAGVPGWSLSLATVTAFTAVSLVGLNLIYGMTGMLALGQAAFVALPAYASGLVVKQGIPPALAIPIGVLIAVVIARLVAEVFVRLPGIYFAIGTLGFAFVVEGLARAFPAITGGASGLVLEPPIFLSGTGWYITALASLAFAICIFSLLRQGRFARRLKLVRHDELAAEVMGINVPRLKATVFTIGSAFSAAGGALLAYYTQVISPESGGVTNSVEALAMVVIGGSGSLFGPLLGAVTVNWLFSIAGGAGRFELLLYGLGFFLVILYAPKGLAGLLNYAWASVFSPAQSRHAQPVSLLDDSKASVSSRKANQKIGDVCLEVASVSKRFGGLQAVHQVDLHVRFGQIVAVIGPNGAGKSTLFNTISGLEAPDEGVVRIDGHSVVSQAVCERARLIGRSFQVPRLVPDLTVLENVRARLDQFALGDEAQNELEARTHLEAFGLADLAHLPAGQVGLGQHKIIELVRASAGTPLLLLLDEPAVGLATGEVARLAELLRDLKALGAAILVVEHNMSFVAAIADEVVVMDSGCVIARGAPAAVMQDEKVKAAYLGAIA